MRRSVVAGPAALAAVALWFACAGGGYAAMRPAALQVANELTTKNVRSEESNLADVICDAVRAADSADIAFMAASSFEDTTVKKGSATDSDFVRALAFKDDSVVIMKLTGAQVKKGLEHGLELYPQRNSAFLQVSGITVSIDGSAARGKHVTGVKVGRNEISETKTYMVAMPAPLANGALNYVTCWEKSAIDHNTDKSLEDALTTYLAGKRTVGETGEDRLVIKK